MSGSQIHRRVDRELVRGTHPVHVLRRHQLLTDIGLIRDDLLDGDLEVRREAPNESANRGPAEEEGRIGDQLDRLRRLPANEPVRSVAHRFPAERRGPPLVARHGPELVRGQDAHVVHRVVEHLGILLPEPEDGGQRIPLRHAGDPVELGAVRRGHHRVVVGVERELDVRRRDGLSVMPARARIEVEDERERAVPLPFLRQQRLKVLIPQRVLGHPDVGELQEQLLADVVGDDVLARRRQQRARLGHGGVDDRAAVRAGTAAAALARGEPGDAENKEDGERGKGAPLHGA